jgi:hypothetical protein
MIRNAAAQDIVAFLGILEPRNWPECLTLLVNQLDDQDPVNQEVCLFFPPSLLFRFGFGWASAAHALLHAMLIPAWHSSWLCQKFERETLPPSLPIASRDRKALFVLGVHALSKHRRYRTSGSPHLEDNQLQSAPRLSCFPFRSVM